MKIDCANLSNGKHMERAEYLDTVAYCNEHEPVYGNLWLTLGMVGAVIAVVNLREMWDKCGIWCNRKEKWSE